MAANRKGKARRKSGSPAKRKKAPKGGGGQSVTLDQAMDLAVQIHRGGIRTKSEQALGEARVLYERILDKVPDHPDALHFFGVLLHQTGEPERGEAMIRRAVEVRPDYVDAWNNLGNLLKEAGRATEARQAYQQATLLRPDHADALCNLGALHAAEGELEHAAELYERALDSDPDHVGAHHNLANTLRRLGRREEAIGHYRAAIALDPHHPDARKLLGQALYYEGRIDDAIEVLESWARLEPDNPEARHMLAACSGKNVPSRASDDYVKKAFDTLAGSFDEHLRGLEYRAPELVQAALESLLPAGDASLDVLDAGCGTGLCAHFLRPWAKHLCGVDLSEGMLAHARRLALYDEIAQEELTAFVKRHRLAFDVVVSADTLCYFGDLQEVLEATFAALRPGGTLVFTVEKAKEASAGFLLHPHGRYAHTEAYVSDVLARAGFGDVSAEGVVLRLERGEPVRGLLVSGRRD